jgi:hypothetical protein
MRRSLARFSEPEASDHTPSLADFITTTPELKFSVHTTERFEVDWAANYRKPDRCLAVIGGDVDEQAFQPWRSSVPTVRLEEGEEALSKLGAIIGNWGAGSRI